MHQFGWLSERRGQLLKFASERGGYPPKKGEVPSEKAGFQPVEEETVGLFLCIKHNLNSYVLFSVSRMRYLEATILRYSWKYVFIKTQQTRHIE